MTVSDSTNTLRSPFSILHYLPLQNTNLVLHPCISPLGTVPYPITTHNPDHSTQVCRASSYDLHLQWCTRCTLIGSDGTLVGSEPATTKGERETSELYQVLLSTDEIS